MANKIKTSINDLDAAIRLLETSTNPTTLRRQPCNCNATRHALLTSAPNCLNCGKIICIKEGLGPCTFCHAPLLSASETQAMIRSLREERGREKMEANNAVHKRADVSKTARAFMTSTSSASSSPAASRSSTPPLPLPHPHPSRPSTSQHQHQQQQQLLAAAQSHRDKLLSYQETSARRTRVIDQAADFETPMSGTLSMWAGPQERAMQLKRQQRVLREQEWNARPEYEKRRAVVSLDLVGGKVVKRMGLVEDRRSIGMDMDMDVDGVENQDYEGEGIEGRANTSGDGGGEGRAGGGTFSRNPLLGELIRPVWPGGKGKEPEREGIGEEDGRRGLRAGRYMWRRVQDDRDDNEDIILDGGVYGRREPAEEPVCQKGF